MSLRGAITATAICRLLSLCSLLALLGWLKSANAQTLPTTLPNTGSPIGANQGGLINGWQSSWRSWWEGSPSEQPMVHRPLGDLQESELSLARTPGTAFPSANAPRSTDAPTELPESETPMAAGSGSQQTPAGFRPDRITALHSQIHYHEVFEPAITPWKRLIALDHIQMDRDGVPILVPGPDASQQPVDVAARPSAAFSEEFIGRLVLEFGENHTLRFPSVAPNMLISYLRTDPEVPLEIARDRSDNYFATLRSLDHQPMAARTIRVAFGARAPADYFGGPLPNVNLRVLAAHVPPVPENVRRDGLIFARELGLTPNATLSHAIEVLTAHFRSFVESETPPHDTGNIFLDLARGRRGICRHRAFGFVLTAQALGIYARFVHNEAHAWVEVEVANGRFRRIDLGGASPNAEVTGVDRNTMPHQPTQRDALPSPSTYAESRSLMLPQSQPTTPPQGTPPQGTPPQAETQGQTTTSDPSTGPNSNSATADPHQTSSVRSVRAGQTGPAAANPGPAPGPISWGPMPEPVAPQTTTRAEIVAAPGQAQRGLTVDLRGRTQNPSNCVVWIYLVDAQRHSIRIGQTESANGVFSFSGTVPRNVPVGRYRLEPVVISCSDAR